MPQEASRKINSSILLSGLLLLWVGVAAKAAMAAGAYFSAGAPWSLMLLWPLATGQDALLVAIWLLIQTAIWSWPTVDKHRFARWSALAFIMSTYFLMANYILGNIHLFLLLGTPLNARQLAFTGETGGMFSSLQWDVPWLALSLVALHLIAFPLACWKWGHRIDRLLDQAKSLLPFLPALRQKNRVLQVALLLVAWWGVSQFAIWASGLSTQLNNIRKNAVVELVSSSLSIVLESPNLVQTEFDKKRPTFFDAGSPFTSTDSDANSCGEVQDAKKGRYNIIIWFMESWTAQDLQVYGGSVPNTPNLSRMAQEGMRFDRYHAASPVSIKSIFNAFCSMYPYPEFDFITSINPRIDCHSLTEVLAEEGYRGALFHGGHFDFTNKLAFFDERGFELLMDSTAFHDSKDYFTFGWGVEDKALVDKAVEWLDTKKPEPFFIVFIPIIPHYPYILPDGAKPKFSTKSLKSRYHNGLYYEDELVGNLQKELEDRGLAENTITVVVGDHGQAFQQHPHNRLHANYLYQENTWIPLVIHNKKLFPKEETCGRVGSHVDLAPTLLDLLKISIPGRYQGRSLISDNNYQMALMSTMYMDHLLGLRDADLKYMYNLTTGTEEVYDLAKDPQEKTNIAADLPDRTKKYREILVRWRAFQHDLVRNYESITGHRKVDRYSRMQEMLEKAEVWLEDSNRKRACDRWEEKKLGRFWGIHAKLCRDAESWMYVGVQHMLVGDHWTTAYRLHPPEKGKLVMKLPLPEGVSQAKGRAAIWDRSVGDGGAPVQFKFSLNGVDWIERPLQNKKGFQNWSVELNEDQSKTLWIELSTNKWNNRVCCFTLDQPSLENQSATSK